MGTHIQVSSGIRTHTPRAQFWSDSRPYDTLDRSPWHSTQNQYWPNEFKIITPRKYRGTDSVRFTRIMFLNNLNTHQQ
jgi:hypothetical protein